MRMTLSAVIKPALVASALFGTVALAGTASAMPVTPLQTDQSAKVEQARWVCGWRGHCFWRPNFYAYNYYAGPRFYHRPWGWHRFHRHWW